jgi:hypothetical protein
MKAQILIMHALNKKMDSTTSYRMLTKKQKEGWFQFSKSYFLKPGILQRKERWRNPKIMNTTGSLIRWTAQQIFYTASPFMLSVLV